MQQITVKLRLRDKHAAELNRQAQAVNCVWNYANDAQKHLRRWDRRLSYPDLAGLTAGAAKDLDIHSHTVQRVCREYVTRRVHRRDANSAKNVLRIGLDTLVGGAHV